MSTSINILGNFVVFKQMTMTFSGSKHSIPFKFSIRGKKSLRLANETIKINAHSYLCHIMILNSEITSHHLYLETT